VALAGLVLLACCAGAARGIAVVARHRAETAADLAALAAASRVAGGHADWCAVAERIAAANGARLSGCRAIGPVVEVEVQAAVSAGRLGGYRADARSRAGPADRVRP
jgi:secretion/DNA translocation related TadE-like protein